MSIDVLLVVKFYYYNPHNRAIFFTVMFDNCAIILVMQYVTVRKLLREFNSLEFPVIITKWGKPIAVILDIESLIGLEDYLIDRPIGSKSKK